MWTALHCPTFWEQNGIQPVRATRVTAGGRRDAVKTNCHGKPSKARWHPKAKQLYRTAHHGGQRGAIILAVVLAWPLLNHLQQQTDGTWRQLNSTGQANSRRCIHRVHSRLAPFLCQQRLASPSKASPYQQAGV